MAESYWLISQIYTLFAEYRHERRLSKEPTALQESVTQQIITHLEEGIPTWARPWSIVSSLPMNAVTSRHYSGANILMLWCAAQEAGYKLNHWLTFKQAQEIKAKIRKGEKSTRIIYVNFQEREENGVIKRIPFTVIRWVFNVAQVDNLPAGYLGPMPRRTDDMALRHAYTFMEDGPVRTAFGGSIAAYYPKKDLITMPERSAFIDDTRFFGTWAHEHIHATGAESRLKRDMGRWGDEARAMEEMVAELGSAFACCELDIKPSTRASAAYVASWLKVLKNDSRALFTAASRASQAVAYLHKMREPIREAAE